MKSLFDTNIAVQSICSAENIYLTIETAMRNNEYIETFVRNNPSPRTHLETQFIEDSLNL